MVQFYDVQGLLVRRWVPGQRRLALEVWTGDGWARYADVDHVLRYGRRLTDVEALTLLIQIRGRNEALAHFSDDEARSALTSRLRRH